VATISTKIAVANSSYNICHNSNNISTYNCINLHAQCDTNSNMQLPMVLLSFLLLMMMTTAMTDVQYGLDMSLCVRMQPLTKPLMRCPSLQLRDAASNFFFIFESNCFQSTVVAVMPKLGKALKINGRLWIGVATLREYDLRYIHHKCLL